MSSAGNSKSSTTTSSDPMPSFAVPESRLGNYYEQAITQTLNRYLASIRYSEFKLKYPELHKEIPDDLRDLYKQLKNQLRTTITNDIKFLSTETGVFASLKALDDLIAKQSDRANEDTWRPSGNPENDIRDHIYYQKQKHKKCLEFVLETYIAENNKLEEAVEQNHAGILQIQKEIDDIKQEIQNTFDAVNSLDYQKLEEDIHTLFGKH